MSFYSPDSSSRSPYHPWKVNCSLIYVSKNGLYIIHKNLIHNYLFECDSLPIVFELCEDKEHITVILPYKAWFSVNSVHSKIAYFFDIREYSEPCIPYGKWVLQCWNKDPE